MAIGPDQEGRQKVMVSLWVEVVRCLRAVMCTMKFKLFLTQYFSTVLYLPYLTLHPIQSLQDNLLILEMDSAFVLHYTFDSTHLLMLIGENDM